MSESRDSRDWRARRQEEKERKRDARALRRQSQELARDAYPVSPTPSRPIIGWEPSRAPDPFRRGY